MTATVILVTAGYDHSIRFWEAPTGRSYRNLQYNESQINSLTITSDKKYLAVAANPHVRLYDIPSSNTNPVISFDGHSGNVTAVGFQKDRKWMFTASEDGSVKIWDIRAPGGYQRDYQSKAPINTAVLHPNQGEVISGDEEGNIRVWDLTANQCSVEAVPEGKTPIRSVTVASDASLLVAANNRGVCFPLKMGRGGMDMLPKVEAHNSYCLKCVLSPDARWLATTSADKTIKLWSVERKFELERKLEAHHKWVWDCAFSADSAYLVSASSDKTAKLWDLKSGEVILDYTGHQKALTAIALNDTS